MTMGSTYPADSILLGKLNEHLARLYPQNDNVSLARAISDCFPRLATTGQPPAADLWTQADSILITYGDSIQSPGQPGLQTLYQFLDKHVENDISTVHVLPFCPYSSDDGFAVIDYLAVAPRLGNWRDLSQIGARWKLMADLVLNHVSSQSAWFDNYVHGLKPGSGYFCEAAVDDDLSRVVRPRTSPLLRPTATAGGLKYLWCTFSHDQIDLNFANPAVLLEFIKIIAFYLDKGVRLFRLDAIGYLWKQPGTTCIHLPQTHEMVRLLRTVVDHVAPGTVLITETNVPNHENLSYFGNCNEAHVIYNFSLAPLVVHALLTGSCQYLQRWMMSMPPAPLNCTYLNFTASHDGIGMRPAEGLLSDEEQIQMLNAMHRFGGRFSSRRTADGSEKIYEVNISLFDACRGTVAGADEYQVSRFLCSQTLMMGVEGIPAFYIHSLLATPNDELAVQRTGMPRSINRHSWDAERLWRLLSDPDSIQRQVLSELRRRLQIRCQQPAFHPSATQFTLHLDDRLFGFWRQSSDRRQSIFAIHNVSDQPQTLPLSQLNLISTDAWHDLLAGTTLPAEDGSLVVAPYQCLWISNRQQGTMAKGQTTVD